MEDKYNERYKQFTKEDCLKWLENKYINPKTGRKLKENSVVVKELDKQCKIYFNNNPSTAIKKNKANVKSIFEEPLNKAECNKWFENDTINPRTNYYLDKKGKLYSLIKEQCKIYEILNDNKSVKNNSKKSDIDSINSSISMYKSKLKDEILSDKETLELTNKIKELEKEKRNTKLLNTEQLYYPSLDDNTFSEKINSLYEFNMHKIPEFKTINSVEDFNKNAYKLCNTFEKTFYQHLISHYISIRTPYKSMLLYHGVGVGKTCSAITLSENLLLSHLSFNEPKIWVIMPSALRSSFKEQIFSLANIDNMDLLLNQCTGDTYIKLAQLIDSKNKDKAALKIKKIINSRYRLFTYDEFAKVVENEYNNKSLNDKVIIIDEAHNIRNSSKQEDKRIYSAIVNILKNGNNNKLILLSATPMYNEPTDILDLLYLFLLNDKRDDILETIKPPFPDIFDKNDKIYDNIKNILTSLSKTYISYLRGKNPFTFAIKLTPKENGFKILDKFIPNDPNNNPIPASESNWINKINEGIILSKLGEKQSNNILKKQELNENNVLANLQPMNIVYENQTGSAGFSKFFNRLSNKNTLSVDYNKKYVNALYPSEDFIGKYSGKFLTISNFIMNSNGIVVIYSRFIDGGILPVAIMLEHMGFNRYGENNILNKPTIIKNPPKYNFNNSPNYCIMTSHSELNNVMGTTTIDKLLPVINNPKNVNGELIKVILITPVASEGLSFYNVREMHLIEPWYHFNKSIQIIGRGIRNCRHNNLPLEERNMSVYMHASFDNYKKETPDIHAYRISSKKLYQSNVIDKLIRDNSFDCYLMKNINFFSKKIFNFNIKLKTSQNKLIDYTFGDNDELKPNCNYDKLEINKSGFRKETYKHLVTNAINLVKSLIINKKHNGYRFIEFDELLKDAEFDADVIFEAINNIIYPNNIIENTIIIPHNNGLHIIDIFNVSKTSLRILYKNDVPETKKTVEQNIIPNALSKLEFNDTSININTISIYLSFDSITYKKFIDYIITTDYNLLKIEDKYIASCFYRQGALIHKKELKLYSTNDKIMYIGYFNIYSETPTMNLYNFDKNNYYSLSDMDIDYNNIIKNRREIIIPNMQKETISSGIILPKKDKNTYNNVFKILSSGISVAKKTGIVCESLLKSEHDNIIKELKIDINTYKNSKTKQQKCNIISENLLKINRLYMYPLFKPNEFI